MTTGGYFLDLSETRLYIVCFDLGPLFSKITKNCLHRFIINVKQEFFRFDINTKYVKLLDKVKKQSIIRLP